MLVYILIFGLSVIFAVLVLWYFDPLNREGFQAVKNTYEIIRPADYSGMGSERQVAAATAILAQEACDAAPGCIEFLYYAGMAYLTIDVDGIRAKAAAKAGTMRTYNTGTNDIINTLVPNNPTQTFTIYAKRRYVRVLPSRLHGGWNGISQVVILDHNNNNIGIGKSTYSPSTGAGYTETVIDADTSTIENNSYKNRSWGNPPPMWLSNENLNGYWEIDLGDIVNISTITIYYRGDDPERMGGVSVVASNSTADSTGKLDWWKAYGSLPGQGQFILMTSAIDQTLTANYSGRYVRIMPSLLTEFGDGKLSISSVIVKNQAGVNVSLGKPTYITNPDAGSQPVTKIVSGSTASSALVTTAGNRSSDYIEIDLGSVVDISTIRIIGGSNSPPVNRMSCLRIKISTTTDTAPKAAYSTAATYRIKNVTVPTFTPPAPKVTIPTPSGSFWNVLNKVNTDDSETLTTLTKVKDPDPNDPNDVMPLSFSKYISIYALSEYTGKNWEVIENKCVQVGSDIKDKQLKGTVLEGKAACIATPGCTEFARVDGINYLKSITPTSAPMTPFQGCTTYKYTSDASGARSSLFNNYDVLEQKLSNEVYSAPPAGTDPKVKSCSNLETAKADYMAQYNAIIKSNQDLSGQAIAASAMREENLAYQTTNLASCKGSPSPACISLANQEAPVFSLLANYDNVNNTMASSGFYDLSNNIDVINTAYALLGCSGSAPIKFSPNDTGVIDTQTLMSNLNKMSPYYLSPDTLQYITSSIVSTSYTDKSLMTDADKLANISKVINNLKAITGAT